MALAPDDMTTTQFLSLIHSDHSRREGRNIVRAEEEEFDIRLCLLEASEELYP